MGQKELKETVHIGKEMLEHSMQLNFHEFVTAMCTVFSIAFASVDPEYRPTLRQFIENTMKMIGNNVFEDSDDFHSFVMEQVEGAFKEITDGHQKQS